MPKPALGRVVHVFVDPARNNGDGSEVPWATSLTLWNDRESAEKTAAYTTAANGDRILSAAFWPPIV